MNRSEIFPSISRRAVWLFLIQSMSLSRKRFKIHTNPTSPLKRLAPFSKNALPVYRRLSGASFAPKFRRNCFLRRTAPPTPMGNGSPRLVVTRIGWSITKPSFTVLHLCCFISLPDFSPCPLVPVFFGNFTFLGDFSSPIRQGLREFEIPPAVCKFPLSGAIFAVAAWPFYVLHKFFRIR